MIGHAFQTQHLDFVYYRGSSLFIRGGVKNIARGTTDPEIDSITWIELGNDMAPLTLVANLDSRWRHLH